MDTIENSELLSIKEFAAFSGIEQTTLRYWDEIGVFSPALRHPENNYRYYTPPQVIAINFITTLSSLGVPLKVIGEISNNRTPENIMELIEEQETRLDMEMRRLRESYSTIHILRELIKIGLNCDENKISVVPLKERTIVFGPKNSFDDDGSFYEKFMDFCYKAKPLRINLHYPIGGYYDSFNNFVTNSAQPNNFFSVDPTGYDKRPAGNYMVAFTRGYYGEMGDAPKRMLAFLRENSLKPHGPIYVVYLHNEISIKDTGYLAQISVAVKKEK